MRPYFRYVVVLNEIDMPYCFRESFEQDDAIQFGSDDADACTSTGDFAAIADRFSSLSEVSNSIKRSGVTNCGLIFGTF